MSSIYLKLDDVFDKIESEWAGKASGKIWNIFHTRT